MQVALFGITGRMLECDASRLDVPDAPVVAHVRTYSKCGPERTSGRVLDGDLTLFLTPDQARQLASVLDGAALSTPLVAP